MVAVVAVTAVILVAAAHLGGRVIDRAHAQAAADAAALAGVMGGEPAAREVARLNHAHLWAFVIVDDWTVEVLVTVDGERGVARATRAP